MSLSRNLPVAAALIALASCTTEVPDSGAGVGFSDYTQYELDRARREAALSGEARAEAAMPASTDAAITETDLAAVGIGTQAAASAPQQPAPADGGPLAANPGISDEQDFEAVAARETIESDAERLERQAAAYTVIEPTALPQRPGATGPNIVQYAINAPNDRGQAIYSRGGLSGEARFQRNCAKYNTPDDAQRDFLSRGGPQRDRLGIDPDGDGFACGWDPTPFRQLAGGN
jgi:hypothetical protein